MHNWNCERWNWKRAVRRDARLSDAAKLLATALCDDFAHHETAFCNPKVGTMARALGKANRSIQRAIMELKKAGWISVRYARGRGRSSQISFSKGDGTVAYESEERVTSVASSGLERVTSVASKEAERVTSVATKGDSRDTPYIKPKIIQKRPGSSERPSPQCSKVVHHDSPAEVAWNDWLTARGFPPLKQIGWADSDAQGRGWDMPFRYPPDESDRIEHGIAEKRVWWLINRANEREVRHA